MLNVSGNRIEIRPKMFELEIIKISSLIDHFSQQNKNLFYFSNPSSDFEVLALGKIFSLTSDYSEIKSFIKTLLNQVNLNDTNNLFNHLPILFGYHKFPSIIRNQIWNDYQNSEWILPEIIFYRKNDKSLMINNSTENTEISVHSLINDLAKSKKHSTDNKVKLKLVDSDSYDQWQKKVYSAISKIKSEELQKIVLSRKKEFEIQNEISFNSLLETLNKDYGDCFNFLIKSKKSFFFGSSPELLIKVADSEFKSEALAGSIQRGISEMEDENLSKFLLNDEKNLKEHQIVIDYLKINLDNKITDFQIEPKPKIKRLKNIQHLHTQISGKIKSDSHFFDMVESIFPTPAVCGIPTNKAISELNKIEGFERGLFTGMLGWFNLYNQAEFHVAIRCGLILDNILTVFAGCGIVEDSIAKDEFEETELKFKAITDLFDVEN